MRLGPREKLRRSSVIYSAIKKVLNVFTVRKLPAKLTSTIVLVLFLTGLVLPLPGVQASPAVYLWESYSSNDDTATYIYGNEWSSQTFTIGSEAHTVTQLRLKLYKVGSPGTLTASIQEVDVSGPSGIDLTSGTIDGDSLTTSSSGAWYGIDMTPYSLEAGKEYAIVLRAVAGTSTSHAVRWRMDGSAGTYAGGKEWLSTNGGVTWTDDADDDYMFEVYGSPCLEITGANVFSGYLEENDWLVVADIRNTYPPYYPSYSPGSYFKVQLLDLADDVIAQVPLIGWAGRPVSIYLSEDQVAALDWGSAYTIRLYGNFGANPYVEYELDIADWKGSDLYFLDEWIRLTALVLEEYYEIDLLVAVAGVPNLVLNPDGASLYLAGIPGLADVRGTSILQVSVQPPDLVPEEFNRAGEEEINWQDRVGVELATKLTDFGELMGVDGVAVGGIGLVLVTVLLGLFLGLAGLALCLPIIIGGAWLGLIPLNIFAVLAAFILLYFVMEIFWKRA